MKNYTEATSEAGRKFYLDFNTKGAFVMLNLLKFNKTANYPNSNTQISGEEAYNIYLKNIVPIFKSAGSEVLFYGNAKSYLIGPNNENWDTVLLMKHSSVEKFIEISKSQTYLNNSIHQKASLTDFRLLPIIESEIK